MGQMNLERAGWAYPALEAFAKETGQNLKEEEAEAIGDLIGDLMHLAESRGHNAEDVAQRGLEYYREEKELDE